MFVNNNSSLNHIA